MTIVRWDPFSRFRVHLAEHVDAAGGHFPDRRSRARAEAELPDMSRDEIDINIENFVLT